MTDPKAIAAIVAEMRELLADEMRWHFDKPTVCAWADQLAAAQVRDNKEIGDGR